ncbi:uncharacterized protein RCC_09513 [Ramularia collo-cygni]|uniref:Uncharacterized protein n=1 Tax=Ramularia collo-cygni TaxID=112498 RepID=A0A2D3VK90_9PEZI|nr:uncharacterized protein RCC_09513 [Ramularia collo-cygni]CZT23799.1 uncharacterized protein RCC_09513 [Ramularia collo-cygni]
MPRSRKTSTAAHLDSSARPSRKSRSAAVTESPPPAEEKKGGKRKKAKTAMPKGFNTMRTVVSQPSAACADSSLIVYSAHEHLPRGTRPDDTWPHIAAPGPVVWDEEEEEDLMGPPAKKAKIKDEDEDEDEDEDVAALSI